MNVAGKKTKTPLGEVLFSLEEWQRVKIKKRLSKLGISEGKWRSLHGRVDAHLVPKFVRDVIVDELPETADLFEHPKLKSSLQES